MRAPTVVPFVARNSRPYTRRVKRVTAVAWRRLLPALCLATVVHSSPLTAQTPDSLKVLRDAAASGNAAAQYALGATAEKNGDMADAFLLYQRAALMGYAGAQFHVARLLETGNGVAPDYMAAEAWYRQAAQAKFAPAVARVQRLDAARQYERARAAQAGAAPAAAATPSPSPTVPLVAPALAVSRPPTDWPRVGMYLVAALLALGAFVALPALGRRRRRR